MTLARRFMIIKNRGRGRSLGRSFEKPRPSLMTSRTQVFGHKRVRACDAFRSPGKQRNDTRTQTFHRLANRTKVRFRCNSWLISNAGSATNSGYTTSDYLNWEMVAMWLFVMFSFAALAFTGYFIFTKCDSPSAF